jgi:hypothetical protein
VASVAQMAISPRLSTARLGVAALPVRRPRPHQPKKPAGLSRQASYAVTLAGALGAFRDCRQDIEQLLRKCGARQQQEDLTRRPEAIRRLLELGLKAKPRH